MKTASFLFALAVCLALLLVACTSVAGSDAESPAASLAPSAPAVPSEESIISSDSSIVLVPEESSLYRGRVEEIMEDGSLLVAQLDGFDYGQPQILFLVDGDTQIIQDDPEAPIAVDAFVEVVHSTAITFSIPPQTMASSITVLSRMSQGMVMNGEVLSIDELDGTYHISILTLNENGEAGTNESILLVPMEAFEGITAQEVTAGAKVSAVTRGIAALSEPPQIPVHRLLPYMPAAPGSDEPANSVSATE